MKKQIASRPLACAGVVIALFVLAGCSAPGTVGIDDVAGSFDANAREVCESSQTLALDDEEDDENVNFDGAADSTLEQVRDMAQVFSESAEKDVQSAFSDLSEDDAIALCAISVAPVPDRGFTRAILAVAPDDTGSAWVYME